MGLLPGQWDRRQKLARIFGRRLGVSEERCPQRPLPERTTPLTVKRTAKSVAHPAVRVARCKLPSPESAPGPVLFQPLLIGDSRNGEKGSLRFHVGSQSVHSSNGVKILRPDIRSGGINEPVLHMNPHNLPENDPGTPDLHRGDLPALQTGGSLLDARDGHHG